METFTFYLSFPGEAGSWVWRTKGANEPELVVQIQATGFTGLQLEATGISLYLSLFHSLQLMEFMKMMEMVPGVVWAWPIHRTLCSLGTRLWGGLPPPYSLALRIPCFKLGLLPFS